MLCFLLLLGLPLSVMGEDDPQAQTIGINKTFTSQGECSLTGISTPIAKLAVTGDVSIQNTEDFLVRVLLTDTSGNDYLVYENYPEICGGSKERLSNVGVETSLLRNVTPAKIRIFVKNATLAVQSVNVSPYGQAFRLSQNDFSLKFDSLRLQQAKATAEKIATYNEAHGKTWGAGVTRLALMDYQQRKQILGLPDSVSSQGIEYYVDGVFVLRAATKTQKISESDPFVSSFDWRNRHGVNWMTPVKDQGNSGYCSAFSAVSCVEALTNLYYNKKIDLDLSEQEAACCNDEASKKNPYKGMSITAPLGYFKDHGVCDEGAYPFVDADSAHNCRSDEVTPAYTVRINDYKLIRPKKEEVIKKAIITKGPLSSGFYFGYNWDKDTYVHVSHAMALTGWRVLQAGDTIKHLHYRGNGSDLSACKVIMPGDSLIGSTVWIFKNSYTENGEDIMSPEYMYIVFDNLSNMHFPYSIEPPIVVSNMSTDSIVCEDKDGDGYYNWGIGPKPASCPSWVPDEEDGDDSNPDYGPMDEYGHLEVITPDSCEAIHISQSTQEEQERHFWRNVVIDPNVQWTVCGKLFFHNGARLVVSDKAALKLTKGAFINDATLDIAKGAILDVQDESQVKLRAGKSLFVPKGGTLTIESGAISH